MAKELKRIDVSKVPELLRIAQEVRNTQEPRLLRQDSEDLALITPLRRRAKGRAKGRPVTKDDPLWNIIGIGHSEGPGDVSENKHKYLAEAYAPKAE